MSQKHVGTYSFFASMKSVIPIKRKTLAERRENIVFIFYFF